MGLVGGGIRVNASGDLLQEKKNIVKRRAIA